MLKNSNKNRSKLKYEIPTFTQSNLVKSNQDQTKMDSAEPKTETKIDLKTETNAEPEIPQDAPAEEDVPLQVSKEWLRSNGYDPNRYSDSEYETDDPEYFKNELKKRKRIEVTEEKLNAFEEVYTAFTDFLGEDKPADNYDIEQTSADEIRRAYLDFIKYCVKIKRKDKTKGSIKKQRTA